MTQKSSQVAGPGRRVQRLLLVPCEPLSLRSYASLLQKLPGRTFEGFILHSLLQLFISFFFLGDLLTGKEAKL